MQLGPSHTHTHTEEHKFHVRVHTKVVKKYVNVGEIKNLKVREMHQQKLTD